MVGYDRISTRKHDGRARAHKFFVPEDERVSSVKTRFVADNAKEAYYGFLARDKLSKAWHQ